MIVFINLYRFVEFLFGIGELRGSQIHILQIGSVHWLMQLMVSRGSFYSQLKLKNVFVTIK